MSWTEVAPNLDTQNQNDSLVVFEGEIYCGTGLGGRLFKWNGSNLWIEVAPQLGEAIIHSLIVFNGKIYGGTGFFGKLYEWNGTNAWIERAGTFLGELRIHAMIVFEGELYAGTEFTGRLFKWNNLNSWIEAAPQLNLQGGIRSLVIYNSELYAGTNNGGRLFKWNGSNAWIEKAPQFNTTSLIHSLVVLNNKIYGSTGADGLLLEWNGTNAWTQAAPELNGQDTIRTIIVVYGRVFGGTSPGGRLFEWNGTNAWIEVCGQLNGQTHITEIIEFNGNIYGSAITGGRLFEYPVPLPLFGIVEDTVLSDPETLFKINYLTAAATFFKSLITETLGEAIAYNPIDGFIYHMSGEGVHFFEKVDLITKDTINIPLSGATFDRATCLTWDDSAGHLLMVSFSENLYSVTTAGFVSLIGAIDHQSYGIAFKAGALYSVPGDAVFDNTLRTINKATGATLTTKAMVFADLENSRGLAFSPFDDNLYVIFKIGASAFDFKLGTIDEGTGIITEIGNTGNRFYDIAFQSTTNYLPPSPVPIPSTTDDLYGITGDGAAAPETLFTLDTDTAAAVLFLALGNGNSGESIAISADDNLLYHMSGTPAGTQIFESVNLDTMAVTNIPLSGDPFNEEVTALVWDSVAGHFLAASFDEIYTLTPAGVVGSVGIADHEIKGLAFKNGVLYTTSPLDPLLRTMDKGTLVTLTETPIAFAGMSGSNGLSYSVQNDKLYFLIKSVRNPGDRALGIITESTGEVIEIGLTGDKFAGLAFTVLQPPPEPVPSGIALSITTGGQLA